MTNKKNIVLGIVIGLTITTIALGVIISVHIRQTDIYLRIYTYIAIYAYRTIYICNNGPLFFAQFKLSTSYEESKDHGRHPIGIDRARGVFMQHMQS